MTVVNRRTGCLSLVTESWELTICDSVICDFRLSMGGTQVVRYLPVVLDRGAPSVWSGLDSARGSARVLRLSLAQVSVPIW